MISFADMMLQVAVALGSTTPMVGPSSALEARVREALAARAGVGIEQLQLDWGRLPMLPADTVGLVLRIGPASTDGWQLVTFIPRDGSPVSARVRSGRTALRPVAARSLAAGSVLASDDVSWQAGTLWGNESLTEMTSFDGWQVRRGIDEGETVTSRLIQPPVLIHAGDSVKFVWQHGAVRLERVAMAASSARLGDQVHGRLGTARLSGRVVAEGQALIESAP